MIGTTVSHYRIIEKLGSGGMGVVYKAEDIKLGRLVALKFLPESFRDSRESLERFRREARTASALNHPNICTIYEIDEHDGQPFIAMELLDGETLTRRINGKPMPLDQIIDLSIQISDALDAAHANGILHRDIKPANLFVSTRQHAKILDFGLAKAVPKQVEGSIENFAATRLADLTAPGTATGTIAYMSPEQLRGEDLDGRSDIFSFGLVLYEMASGRPAFTGKTAAVIFDGILREEPAPIRKFNPDVHPQLDSIISKAMSKDRGRRYQSAAELRADFLLLRKLIESTSVQLPVGSHLSPARLAWVGGLAIVLLVGAWLVTGRLRSADQARVPIMTFSKLTSQAGAEYFPSFSSDGRSFTYAGTAAGNWDVFLQRVGGQNPVNLTQDSPSDDLQPQFSPDGEWIAFRSNRDGGGIFVMGATGESVRRLTDFGFNPSWSPDGKEIVFAEEFVLDAPSRRAGISGLWTVNVATGERRQITPTDAVQPNWSPHRHRIVYWSTRSADRDIWTIKPDGSDAIAVTTDAAQDWSPVWSPDGRHIYFSSDRGGSMNLWRIAIDESSGRVLGSPEPITTSGGLVQRQHAAISTDGRRIAYVEQAVTENLQKAAFDPIRAKVTGSSQWITRGARIAGNADPSPDGQWIAFQSWEKQEDIFLIRVDGTGERQLTDDAHRDRVPRWSPDGRRIAFYSNRSGRFEVWMIDPDGSNLEQFTRSENHNVARSVWSPDGKKLALLYAGEGSVIMDVADRSEQWLPPVEDPNDHFLVWSWSPDGKWLAGQRRAKTSGQVKALTVYSIEQQKYEDILDAGDGAAWLNDSRRIVFERDGKLAVIDRVSKKIQDVFTPAPLLVTSLGRLPRDYRSLFFSVTEPNADIWLINFELTR